MAEDYRRSLLSGGVYSIQNVVPSDLQSVGQSPEYIDRRSEKGFVPNRIHPTGFPIGFSDRQHHTVGEIHDMIAKRVGK